MAEKNEKRRGLGRGLSALMADVEPQTTETPEGGARRPERVVPVEKIVPNPDQPRRTFTDEQLRELADSIRSKGVIQPLIVRQSPKNPDLFEIVAGERRWRAAQLAQLHELPIIVREFNDTEVLEIAIIENIQRADLNPIEEAAGYRQLMFKFGHTQEKLAEALGKSRSHIANILRLLTLPEEVRQMVDRGKLTAGHARALVGRDDAIALARQIAAEGMQDKIHDLRPLLTDFAATAILVEQLDVVISICTSVAHLAGGLGVETWVILSQDADWRWMRDRNDSPWYSSVRLFRQRELDNWLELAGRVAEALKTRAVSAV